MLLRETVEAKYIVERIKASTIFFLSGLHCNSVVLFLCKYIALKLFQFPFRVCFLIII